MDICANEKCTLCMACFNVCPKGAIFVDTDENGFSRINIDDVRCVDCGLCKKVCQRRSTVSKEVAQTAYAAQARDQKALEKSASGGAFQMLAQLILERGGVCYGSEFIKEDGNYQARHTRIDTLEELHRILNSKYIPSMIGNIYQQVKQDLRKGKHVLFSGTPCQIQGLRAYLDQEYENLWTADLICHGVTSAKLFNDYIRCIEYREGIEIVDYCFRDKSVSWGTNFSYSYHDADDAKKRVRSRHCPREASSYMIHYLRGNIFRESCYYCDCARLQRVSDFTLGDYWGIEQEHPEFVTKLRPNMALRGGVSCILVNTKKGGTLVHALAAKMVLREVTVESVAAHNGNLRAPSDKGNQRAWVLKTYREDGYAPIDAAYQKTVEKKMPLYRAKNFLKSRLPDIVRILIYRSPVLSRIVFHQ